MTSLYLEVRSDNVAAIGLYDKWRFERVAVRRGYYADGVDAVVLRWRLERGEHQRRGDVDGDAPAARDELELDRR